MRRLYPLLALALALPAQAGWGDFDALFPTFPCADGWMACVTPGGAVSPEPSRDAAGRPMPADLRVGWFDLAPTAAFSPFAGLSAYSGGPAEAASSAAAGAQLAEDAAAKAEAEQIAAAEAQRVAMEQADAARKQREEAVARAQKESEEARRMVEQAAHASAAEKSRLEAEAAAARERAAAAERARIEAEAQERARQEAARVEAERMAKAKADADAARVEAARKAQEEAARKAAEAAAAPTAVALAEAARSPAAGGAGDDCADLARIEPNAMLGTLSVGQVGCLEKRVASDPKMTDKDKASRLLMANAYAKGDKESWEKLVKRHLEEINQSDPDICYKYALHLSKLGPGRASGVIKWSDVALENKTVWTGDTFTSRVFSLYKFRAAAAQSLWQKAETEFAASGSDDAKAAVDKHRNATKVYAREWFEYAKVAGKDATQALQLCMSAAGTKDYCEGS